MLIRRIDKYLAATKTPATRFGLSVAGDPRLVFDIRRGRQPGAAMIRRIEAMIGSGR